LASASKVEICHQCDGAGGFTWDMGEQGGVLKWLITVRSLAFG